MKSQTKRKITVWKIILLIVVIFLVIVGAVIGGTWSQYLPPLINGSTVSVKDVDQATEESVTKKWFAGWLGEHQGWKVPPAWRLKDAEITSIEELDGGYVEIHYRAEISGWSRKAADNLELISTSEKNKYEGQWVFYWNKGTEAWQIQKVMSPVQYQIQSSEFAEEQNEPQTTHFALNNEKEQTYYVQDETLYVTYDHGETLIEVPDGYEAVCGTVNGTYDEYLPDNSYLVSDGLTAFVGYTNQRATLIYSLDRGQSWRYALIYLGGFRANTFLSKTENYCYVSFAVDRTGGSDYYGSFRSSDFENWEAVALPQDLYSNASCIFWKDDNTGYYGDGDTYYLTRDGGASYEQQALPQNDEITARLGYNPYDSLESMYQENGVVYMLIGQGDDGDYAENGKLWRALYKSEDGMHFTFVEENVDATEEAG